MQVQLKQWAGSTLAVGAALVVWVLDGNALAHSPAGEWTWLSAGQVWTPPSGDPGAPAPETAPNPDPTVASAPQKQPGRRAQSLSTHLDPKDLKATLALARPAVARCFEEGLQRHPAAEGRLVARLVIQPVNGVGRVVEATIEQDYTLQDPLIASCTLAALQKLEFPAPTERLLIRYPYSFSRNVADAGAVEAEATPRPERLEVRPGSAPSFGPAAPVVTVVEFTDFECRYCADSHEAMTTLQRKYGHQVRFVFMQKPLPSHPHARLAAAAVIAAHQQGRYLELSDRLYALPSLSREAILDQARALGLDLPRFVAALDAPATLAAVEADLREAARLAVTAVPTYFLNGREVRGARPLEVFDAMLQEELRAAGR